MCARKETIKEKLDRLINALDKVATRLDKIDPPAKE